MNTFVRGVVSGIVGMRRGHTVQLYCSGAEPKLLSEYASMPGVSVIVLRDEDQSSAGPPVTTAAVDRLRHLSYRWKRKSIYRYTNDLLWSRARRVIERTSDVFYYPSTIARMFNSRIPTVLSLHDLQHLHYPEYFDADELHFRSVVYPLSANAVSSVQASTDYMKNDFLRHLPLRPDQVFVVSEGVDLQRFSRDRDRTPLVTRFALPERFILYPAQLWHHKNHLTLLEALRILRDENAADVPLVLTGAKYGAAPTVFEFIERYRMKSVFHLGAVSDEELVGLYQKATMLVMPSLFESSSLPVLEAAAAGTPIVASSIPSVVEMSTRLAMTLFDPRDPLELASTLSRVWHDADTRAQHVAVNASRIHEFSWNRVGEQYINAFERLVA
jgi:glycosyltransferase involved in cell wall biosynthesis